MWVGVSSPRSDTALSRVNDVKHALISWFQHAGLSMECQINTAIFLSVRLICRYPLRESYACALVIQASRLFSNGPATSCTRLTRVPYKMTHVTY